MEKITFIDDDGSKVEFFVLEKTRLGGTNYILVTDSEDEEDEDAVALVLREEEDLNSKESVYRIVSEDNELDAVIPLFENEMEDITIVPEEE